VIAPPFAVGNENCLDFIWIGGWFWFTMLFDPEWGHPHHVTGMGLQP
jgi:hypothetical protein